MPMTPSEHTCYCLLRRELCAELGTSCDPPGRKRIVSEAEADMIAHLVLATPLGERIHAITTLARNCGVSVATIHRIVRRYNAKRTSVEAV
jgi:hypothetical protein